MFLSRKHKKFLLKFQIIYIECTKIWVNSIIELFLYLIVYFNIFVLIWLSLESTKFTPYGFVFLSSLSHRTWAPWLCEYFQELDWCKLELDFSVAFFVLFPIIYFIVLCRISLVNLSLKLACIIIDHFVIVAVLSLCCCWFARSIVLFNLLNSFLLHCYFSAFPLPHAEASTAASICVDVNVGVGASLFRGGFLGLFGDSFNVNYIFHYSSVALAAAAVDCPLHLPLHPSSALPHPWLLYGSVRIPNVANCGDWVRFALVVVLVLVVAVISGLCYW